MSLIPKFLTAAGREEVARASDEARALESQLETERHSLSGKQLRRLERRLADARGVTRRDFLAKLGVGLGTAGAGAAVISLRTEKESEPVSATITGKLPQQEGSGVTVDSEEVSEEELQSIIEHIEIGVGEWEKIIREKVKKNGGLPPYIKENDFWEPFEMISVNSKNKRRNARALLREVGASGNTQLEDVRYFSYDSLDNFSKVGTSINMESMAAFFVPLRRRIYLNPQIDPENPSDFLTICHETRHAAQDVYMRSTTSRDAYFSQIEGRPNEPARLDIRLELDAYSYELELADILLDGKLRDGTIDPEEIFAKLRASNSVRMESLKLLHDISKLYFPLGKSSGSYPTAYYNEIVQIYANQGYEICLPNKKGELEPIQ